MLLQNTVTITKVYDGKTRFEFWTNLMEGNTLTAIVKIEPIRRYSSLYATKVCFEANGDKFSCSITEAHNYLSKLEYE